MDPMTAATQIRPAAASVLVLTRVLDAPRALVWKAWTEPDRLARWWGPRGFTLASCTLDFRPGGGYRFHMRSPEGNDHWLAGTYREIVAPERFVCTFAWLDEAGRPKHEMLLEMSLADRDGKTELTLRQTKLESATARDQHRVGWTESLDRLVEYLATT
jgi:uncharacterized protein YndB with AHSA1/START domain